MSLKDQHPNDEPVESPCVSVCQVDGDDVCIGCGRSIDEIVSWLSLNERERAAVVARARQRMDQRADK